MDAGGGTGDGTGSGGGDGWAAASSVRVSVVFSSGGRKIITAKPQLAEALKRAAPAKSEAWRGLDVAVLQELVLKIQHGIGV